MWFSKQVFAAQTLEEILAETFAEDNEIIQDEWKEEKMEPKKLNTLQEKITNKVLLDNDPNHNAAEDILELMGDEAWTYANNAIPTAQIISTTENSATIHTTLAMYNGQDVLEYTVFYFTSPLSTSAYSDILTAKIIGKKAGDKVELILNNLSKNTTYYSVVAPVNPEDETKEPLDNLTSEITFNTKDEIVKEAVQPVEIEKISKVSYKTNENNIELVWESEQNSTNKVDISIRHKDDISYSTIGNVSASTETFSFSVDKAGSYFIKLKLMDASGKQLWADSNLNLTIKEFEKDTSPVITNPPKVGPTTDLMIALAVFAALMYIVYRVRRSDHN